MIYSPVPPGLAQVAWKVDDGLGIVASEVERNGLFLGISHGRNNRQGSPRLNLMGEKEKGKSQGQSHAFSLYNRKDNDAI